MGKTTKWNASTPYGYKYNKTTRHYDVAPDQKAVLLKIFKLYAKGKSSRDIAVYLNQKDIKGSRGGTWMHNTVRRLVEPTRLEFYSGYHKGKRGNWDIIISTEQANKLKLLYTAVKPLSKIKTNEYLLSNSGILFCGYCKGTGRAAISPKSTPETSHYYYFCTNKASKGKCTNSKLVRQDIADELVLSDVALQANSIDAIKKFTRKHEAIKEEGLKDRIRKLDAEHSQLLVEQVKNYSPQVEDEIDYVLAMKREAIRELIPFDFDRLNIPGLKSIESLKAKSKNERIRGQKKLIKQMVDKIFFYEQHLVIEYKFCINEKLEKSVSLSY